MCSNPHNQILAGLGRKSRNSNFPFHPLKHRQYENDTSSGCWNARLEIRNHHHRAWEMVASVNIFPYFLFPLLGQLNDHRNIFRELALREVNSDTLLQKQFWNEFFFFEQHVIMSTIVLSTCCHNTICLCSHSNCLQHAPSPCIQNCIFVVYWKKYWQAAHLQFLGLGAKK